MKWKLAIGMLFLSVALCNQGFAVEFLGHVYSVNYLFPETTITSFIP